MTHARVKRSPAALIVWLLLLVLSFSCSRPAVHDIHPAPAVERAADFDRLFTRTGDGWTGGDGTLSVLLPDGRTVWMFGDSLLGPVLPDGSRPADAPLIRNCLLVQKGDSLKTLTGGVNGQPSAFFTPVPAGQWFWPGDGLVEDGRLRIFLHRFELEEPRLWAWRWMGTELATLSLPSLTLLRIDPAPSPNGILYGACILETPAYTYIYGTADQRRPKEVHLARAPAGFIQGPWTFFNGHEWSDRPADSHPVLSGVSTQYAVLKFRDHLYLFTMDGRVPFSNEIVAYRAQRPSGPWQGPLSIYRAPETDRQVAAYNPFVHPQFSENGRVLLSYNLNHITDPSAVYRNAAIYRPRFIRIDMAETARRFDAGEE